MGSVLSMMDSSAYPPTEPTPEPARPRVGFIGLGIMGHSMASHLLAAGYRLWVYSRTASKAQPLCERGAQWCATAQDLARSVDIVVTMVGYPSDVESLYLSAGGVLDTLPRGGLVIDMTTSDPSLARRIAAAAEERGLQALDAPVSGGDLGARDATLSIMVGGSPSAFERALPLFSVLGKTIRHMGGAGSGQHSKMVNQIVIAGTVLGVAEGLAYAQSAGLELSQVLEVVGGGAAGGQQWNVLGKRMVSGDFSPGFFIHHFLKDMGIANAEATAMGLDLAALRTALTQFRRYADAGGSRDGTQGIFNLYTAAGAAPAAAAGDSAG